MTRRHGSTVIIFETKKGNDSSASTRRALLFGKRRQLVVHSMKGLVEDVWDRCILVGCKRI